MTTMTSHVHGTFCWWELATPDLEAAFRFYQGVFAWGKTDLPMAPGQVYRLVEVGGRQVGAMYQLDEAQRQREVRAAWLPYIAVPSADESARKIVDAGGTLASPPFDVMESGRMALFNDPDGARAAVWEKKQHFGAGVVNEAGSVCWTELAARDAARMRKFYAAAFEWVPDVKQVPGPGEYTEWGVAGVSQSFGGMMQMDANWGDMPPQWSTYFRVDDADATAARIAAGGGKMVMGPFDAPGVGRMGIAVDPTGAGFSIIKLTMPDR